MTVLFLLSVDEARNKMMVCTMDDCEEKPTRPEEEPEAEGSPVISCSVAARSAAYHSCEDITIMSRSTDGAAAAGSAVEDPAVQEVAATGGSAEEADTGGPPDEGEPVKKKMSRLKRIRNFFGRVIRTISRKK